MKNNSRNKIIFYIIVFIAACMIIVIGIISDRRLKKSDAGKISIVDSNGKHIAGILVNSEDLSASYDCEENYMTYADVVFDEVLDCICNKENITRQKAYEVIKQSNWIINTTIDTDLQKKLYDMVQNKPINKENGFAAEINDINGRVLACVSSGDDNDYVLNRTYAGSVIKPLSVYGPAIENGTINWASMVPDAPYKTITDDSGNAREWPVNVESYTYKDYTVADGLKMSLNTIAVRTLKQSGVENSCGFLENKFGMDVAAEKESMAADGEDEILGNIALGYLRNGTTVKEMTGYYQVFSNGGSYTKSHAVISIDKDRHNYYQNNEAKSQVFTSQTAYILNRMMKRVLDEGGTASGAYMDGYDIVGKTGTSDKDNWFIACTSNYICSIWKGKDDKNILNDKTDMFQLCDDIIKEIENKGDEFKKADNVEEKCICAKSGKIAGENCKDTMIGYFLSGTKLDICEE
ncbi:penicillin-binding transpeptidase domain-containing protein [Agathobacter sp.]